MGYLSRSELEDLFLSGRFKKAATMVFIEIGGAPGYGVEAVVAGQDGRQIGECGLHELEDLLSFAEADKEAMGSANPNLEIVKWAVAEMRYTTERVAENAKKLAEPQTAQIFRFPTNLRVVGSHQQNQPH